MEIKEAISDVNKTLIEFLRHDHWELRMGLNMIKHGVSQILSGIFMLFRWIIALLAVPFIPVLYPIAIIIRLIKKRR